MTELGRVLKRLDENRVEVEIIRHQDCGDCKICGSLTGNEKKIMVARNAIGAGEGEMVRLELEARRMVGMSALVFLLPILTFVAGYVLVMAVIGQGTAGRTALSIAGGIVVMVLSFIPVIRFSKRQKTPLVRIVDRIEPSPEIGSLPGSP